MCSKVVSFLFCFRPSFFGLFLTFFFWPISKFIQFNGGLSVSGNHFWTEKFGNTSVSSLEKKKTGIVTTFGILYGCFGHNYLLEFYID